MGGRVIVFRHYAVYRRPRFYRYRVADPGVRIVRNTMGCGSGVVQRGDDHHIHESTGSLWIGLVVVVGSTAYCVRWADVKTDITDQEAS